MDSEKKHLFWVDGLKAFAILGILVNHFVESFGSAPWFSNPSYTWPDLATRLSSLFPSGGPIYWRLFQFLGWLGDMGPGVFILISGFTLTLSTLNKNNKEISNPDFYLKRLCRIFPLYLVIHVAVMVSGDLLNKGVGFASPAVFLSMLGLRFTDGLFFYINPSWWFIWLVIQLYLLFPFLYKIMTRKGISFFLLLTLGFTLVSRLAGLVNVTYSDSLEHWMMGIFFGTRLFEFASGMILAKLFFEKQFDPGKISTIKLFVISIVTYSVGFTCSLFYTTTLISNSLITIGLCGLFLTFCKIIESYIPSLTKTLRWIGLVSFPVFLIHQPVMLWLGNDFTGVNRALVQCFVLLLVFPAAWLIENMVNHLISVLPKIKNNVKGIIINLSVSGQLILNLVFFITGNGIIHKADNILFIINIFFIPMYFLLDNKVTNQSQKTILFTFIPTSVLFLFVLTENWFNIFWIFSLILFFGLFLISFLTKNPVARLVAPFILTFVLFGSIESRLSKSHPVEVSKWGELPALQRDPITTYSLIPDKKTHLKYNNYDYYVKTNSLGFNGPEVKLGQKDTNEIRIFIIGDAFTMPEGLEYEKAYPELLQAHLQENFPDKKILVINGGITGFGPNEMYAQLRKYMDTLKPDIFINQLFINEFEEIKLNSGERLNNIGLCSQSIREKLFSNYQIPKQTQYGFHKLLHDKYYKRYNYYKSLTYFYERGSDLYAEETIRKVNNYLKNIKLFCKEKDCEFSVLFAPGQLEISPPEDISYFPHHINLDDSIKYDMQKPGSILRELCFENQIPFLDPTKTLKMSTLQPVYFEKSWHWNPIGHQVIADFLFRQFKYNFKFE